MNKESVVLPGAQGTWGSYISKYQPDSNKVLDNMFTANSKNFVTDQTGMIQKREGGVQWNRTSFSEAAKDTYEAVFESGARHFLRVGGGILSASTGTGLFDVITSGYSSLGNFEWATYQDRGYGCNGVNAPQVYDVATSYGGVSYSFTTAKTKVMGAQAPVTGPTAGSPSAGGAIPVGPHRYKVTFMYYSSEESNGSTASATQTTTAGNQTIALSSIPVGGYGVTARNIYRDNNDGVYLLLDTIPNNTATTYTDTLLIGATPTPLPLFNNVPPTFNKIALWLDSLFIAPTGETNVVRYSNTGSPDIFDPDNFVTCQSDDVITALYVYNGKLYVFGLHSFGSIEGNTPDTFFYHNISNLIGCVDNRSIQIRSIVSVPTLWWLSDKGFYYSNGNTVEYGSDFIQDLVNLNLAQVNYSINKNTQTSFADFSGDTRSPGIDIDTNPGSVMTVDPEQSYSSTADWLGGTVVSNLKTSDSNFVEVPTTFAPSLGSGTLGGSATISGSNLTLPVTDDFTGEQGHSIGTGIARTQDSYYIAQSFTPARSGTFTGFDVWLSGGIAGGVTMHVWSDGSGQPGAHLYQSGSNVPVPGPGANPISSGALSIPMVGGTKYWFGVSSANLGFAPQGATSQQFGNGTQNCKTSGDGGFSWGTPNALAGGVFRQLASDYTYVSTAIPSSGTWNSQTYDCGAISSIPNLFTESGSYPLGTTSVTVYSSPNSNMSGATSQVITNPSGNTSLTLTGYRYWQISIAISTPDNRTVPTSGTPSFTFSIVGTWESQPIDTTTDNTGWGTLTYTGNMPLGTTISLAIATCATQFGTYTSYGPIGSALIQEWAKVRLTLNTTSDNVTSPAVSSVTLTWNVTATITSSIIDTGTVPAGFNTFQWEQVNPGVGIVTFYIRTASTSGGIPSASYVTVANGEFPNLSALEFVQWKAVISSSANSVPEITSITVNWFISTGTVGVRCASLFYNKTYYISVATIGSSINDVLIQLDQFGNWRIQKDTSIGTFLSYFNTLYFTAGDSGLIFNGFIANTDNGVAIFMDVRTKAWNAENDLFLKVPRAFKITGINTGTTIHAYYSSDRGATWVEMLNESGTTGYLTSSDGSEFVTLFVPDATTLVSGRTLMFRITSEDIYPCSILNYVPSFYSRKGRYLNNG